MPFKERIRNTLSYRKKSLSTFSNIKKPQPSKGSSPYQIDGLVFKRPQIAFVHA
uniref:Uncharacterized protein n=1 Tax=Helianthus annuus TaxID=4232 RepID=A0A251RMJ6_HELAN